MDLTPTTATFLIVVILIMIDMSLYYGEEEKF